MSQNNDTAPKQKGGLSRLLFCFIRREAISSTDGGFHPNGISPALADFIAKHSRGELFTTKMPLRYLKLKEPISFRIPHSELKIALTVF